MRKNLFSFLGLSSSATKVLLVSFVLLLSAGCAGSIITPASGEAQSQGQIPQSPQRIVVMPLFAEEMLLEMIGPDRIAGVAHEYYENAEVFFAHHGAD